MTRFSSATLSHPVALRLSFPVIITLSMADMYKFRWQTSNRVYKTTDCGVKVEIDSWPHRYMYRGANIDASVTRECDTFKFSKPFTR